MEEWEEVEIETVSDGFDVTPSELHAAFEISGDHLAEVRDRHTMMLVTSGELPEKHIAKIAPERILNWMVEELNGVQRKDGLSIPLHGADSPSIHISKGSIEGHSTLKLKVGNNFVRKLPLPTDVKAIKASMKDGILDIRW